jgi:hypothetical protein
MDGIEEFEEVHAPDDDTDDENDPRELVTKLINLLLERSVSLVFLSGLYFSVDGSDSGLHSSLRDYAPSGSLLYVCGGEYHVLLVLKHGGVSEGLGVLRDVH